MEDNGVLTREKISIAYDLLIKLKELVAADRFFKEGAEKALDHEKQQPKAGSALTNIAGVVVSHITALTSIMCPEPDRPSWLTEFMDIYEEFLNSFEQKTTMTN